MIHIFGADATIWCTWGLPLHPWYFRLAPANPTALACPGHLGGEGWDSPRTFQKPTRLKMSVIVCLFKKRWADSRTE